MLLKNLKQVLFASLPIFAIVLIVNFAFSPLDGIVNFVVGFVLLVLGETIFLVGVESSIVPMGELVGGASSQKAKSFVVVILFGAIFAVFSTIAEPDMQILASEVALFGLNIPKIAFILIAGFGLGVCVAIALVRILVRVPIWALLLALYGIIFICAIFLENSFIAIAFDSGSATTGVVAAPFFIALCIGFSGTKDTAKSRDDNFGLVGIASLGPVIAIMIMFLISGRGEPKATGTTIALSSLLLDSLLNVGLAIVPLFVIFFLFDLFFLKLPWSKRYKIFVGLILSTLGLFMLMFGLEYGFVSIGKQLGGWLASTGFAWVAIFVGIAFGFLVAFVEPAVSVLAKQVQDVTNNNIKRMFVVIAIAIATAIGVGISVLCVVLKVPVVWVALACFGIIVCLIPFSQRTFLAIGVDSGGVALGPTSSAFIFPIVVGLSSALNAGNTFGALSLIGTVPILVVEIIGVVYNIKIKHAKTPNFVVERRIKTTGVDKYSNIADLEIAYKKFLKEEKHVS